MRRKNFITSYGLRWKVKKTGWLEHSIRDGHLVGRNQAKTEYADFRNQHGLYILYQRDKVKYVGIATRLGKRIRDHCFDRLFREELGQWDTFSWFGSFALTADARLRTPIVPDPPRRHRAV